MDLKVALVEIRYREVVVYVSATFDVNPVHVCHIRLTMIVRDHVERARVDPCGLAVLDTGCAGELSDIRVR